MFARATSSNRIAEVAARKLAAKKENAKVTSEAEMVALSVERPTRVIIKEPGQAVPPAVMQLSEQLQELHDEQAYMDTSQLS